jgi:hypothetical protein
MKAESFGWNEKKQVGEGVDLDSSNIYYRYLSVAEEMGNGGY